MALYCLVAYPNLYHTAETLSVAKDMQLGIDWMFSSQDLIGRDGKCILLPLSFYTWLN